MPKPKVPTEPLEKPKTPEKFIKPYECSLDPETQKRAIEELHEDPEQRLSQVDTLRQWIEEQPHLIARTDDYFLLALLRSAKFSQKKAQEMALRGVEAMMEVPEWFRNLDSRDPHISDIIDKGYCTPLPKRTKNGCQILLYRIAALPPNEKKYTFSDTIRSGILTASFTSKDENVMVNGHIFIFDFTGSTWRHLTNIKLDDLRKWYRIWQKNVPGRFKGFHFYNAGRMFEMLVAATKPFLSTKYQERFHVHNSADSLCSAIGVEYLPEEYLDDENAGKGVGTMPDIIADYKNEVQSDDFREDLLYHTHDYWRIEEHLKPKKITQSASCPKLSVH